MKQRLIGIIHHIPMITPLAYFLVLFAYAFVRYRSYYGKNPLEIPFDSFSLIMGVVLFSASLLIVRYTLIQDHKNLIAELLVTEELQTVFNSGLFKDLQQGEQIQTVKRLTGGYSGAQVYSFHRGKNRVPDIIKIAEVDEIESEHHKFTKHVTGQLPTGPNKCRKYVWGGYAGLEYNIKWTELSSDHLTFLEIYQECFCGNAQPRVKTETITNVIARLFGELAESWGWWNLGLDNVNIYEEHYPFTRKFTEIHPHIKRHFAWGQMNLDSSTLDWARYKQALDRILDVREWNGRKQDRRYQMHTARATIHGDLNSRNILLEASPQDHNEIRSIGLVDFSHTGNGLTMKRTEEAIRSGARIERERGHIANDFCRLEADVKFYLTDLNDNQDLGRAWILEFLLLRYGLELPDWTELPLEEFEASLAQRDLLLPVNLKDMSVARSWQGSKAEKFILVWQSIKTIRDSLRGISQGGVSIPIQTYYLALLRASLPLICYEDHRFHNTNLQKLYLVLASSLLCTKL